MIIIGENIHIISKAVSQAVRERNAKVIQDLAIAQAEAGADYIDLNIGPARRNPEETIQWLVNAVQEVTNLPLSLDSMNPVAVEAGLKICRQKPLINSASGRTDSKEQMMPLAAKYSTDIVISVITDAGVPPDAESRANTMVETITYANELGIPNENIWVDPIMLPVCVEQPQVVACLEFTGMLVDLAPGVKSTLGLSNISNSVPDELRGILNRTYMVMAEHYGQYSVIADALDKELMSLAKGKLPDIIELIHKVMDDETIDPNSLPPKERDYVKTVNVLMGRSLYSHSWLEI
jgi:5-methyltetrahydrofolate corrinoid/iron sulfur protein methyltransferase